MSASSMVKYLDESSTCTFTMHMKDIQRVLIKSGQICEIFSKQFMSTDRGMDGQCESSIPPNLVLGGIKTEKSDQILPEYVIPIVLIKPLVFIMAAPFIFTYWPFIIR
jgi:hypothetical protein